MKILQIGLGGFGKNHLKAWAELGKINDLYIAELDESKHELAEKYGIPKERLGQDYKKFLDLIDVVDIVTPSETHHYICEYAIVHSKDVFVEKPMTMTSKEAEEIIKSLGDYTRILQVGYYYRNHPISRYIKNMLENKELGDIRYAYGNFMGLKRPRTDVGVTHTDAVHFIDLFNYLFGVHEQPKKIHSELRYFFERPKNRIRDLEDLSIVLLDYNGVLVKVESGYVQPGRYKDKVVPNATTTKEIIISGSEKTIEADFESEQLKIYDAKHAKKEDGKWQVEDKGVIIPNIKGVTTVDQICLELEEFLDCVKTRSQPSANARDSGLIMAKIIEDIYGDHK